MTGLQILLNVWHQAGKYLVNMFVFYNILASTPTHSGARCIAKLECSSISYLAQLSYSTIG